VTRDKRWSVILAGGEGSRLRPLTRLISGDDRPKQFCPIIGDYSLLEKTRRRVTRSVPGDQVVVSLCETHREFFEKEYGVDPSLRIVQPCNKGTAPPIIHGLLSIERADPDAVVAVMPCDHHYANEDAFSSALESAFEAARQRGDSIVLMGAQPDYPETEYGWIELGAPEDAGSKTDLYAVRAFQEKPSIETAGRLFHLGCLWNTFVMVGRARAFRRAVLKTLPALAKRLAASELWDGSETQIHPKVYESIPELSFSSVVLEATVECLRVMRLENTGWTDLGNPVRAEQAAAQHGGDMLLRWIRKWRLEQKEAAAAAVA
jgi:mannose-1-phosphate guanylyltransferase